jgi:hypothetical protein
VANAASAVHFYPNGSDGYLPPSGKIRGGYAGNRPPKFLREKMVEAGELNFFRWLIRRKLLILCSARNAEIAGHIARLCGGYAEYRRLVFELSFTFPGSPFLSAF